MKLKTIRVQVQEKSGKKAKAKPALEIKWDGVASPLPLIQRRSKNVQSLLSPQTGKQLSLSELQSLPDKAMVVGSPDPPSSILVEEGVKENEPTESSSKESRELKLLSCGYKLTRHAKDQMYQKDLSAEDILDCCANGIVESIDSETERLVGCKVTLVKSKSLPTKKKDRDRLSIIISLGANLTEFLPFREEDALPLIRGGVIGAMKKELGVGIDFAENGFEIRGDAKGIDRAKHRLLHVSKVENNPPVRVPSPYDMTGRVIGKNGQTIKTIAQRLNIPLQHLHVSWDAARSEMVIKSPLPLSKNTFSELTVALEQIVASGCGVAKTPGDEACLRFAMAAENDELLQAVRKQVQSFQRKHKLLSGLRVTWDGASHEIVVKSPTPLNELHAAKVSATVRKIIQNDADE